MGDGREFIAESPIWGQSRRRRRDRANVNAVAWRREAQAFTVYQPHREKLTDDRKVLRYANGNLRPLRVPALGGRSLSSRSEFFAPHPFALGASAISTQSLGQIVST